jgi:hypothetical protein
MQETEPGIFAVAPGEIINIDVTPIGTGVFVAASLNGDTLSPSSGANTAPHYQFEAEGPVGTVHVLAMEFSFPEGDNSGFSKPDEVPRYEFSISGDQGGSSSFVVRENSPIKDPFFEFTVTN